MCGGIEGEEVEGGGEGGGSKTEKSKNTPCHTAGGDFGEHLLRFSVLGNGGGVCWLVPRKRQTVGGTTRRVLRGQRPRKKNECPGMAES